MRQQTPVARLLTAAFGALVLLIMVSGSAGVAASVLQHRSVHELTNYVLPLRLGNAQLRAVLADAQRGLRGYLLTADAHLLDSYQAARNTYPSVEASVRQLSRGPERAAIDLQRQLAQRWWERAQQQSASAPRSDQAARLVEEGQRLFDQFLQASDSLDGELAERADTLRAASRTISTVTAAALAAFTLLAGLLAIGTARRTTRRITRPLHRLAAVLNRLSAGDRDARAPVTDDLTEISQVACAVNTMADEADRIRAEDHQDARRRHSARALGVQIRQHLAVDSALHEAARGLGQLLDAEQVVVRLIAHEPDEPVVVCWSAEHTTVHADHLSGLNRLGFDWLDDCGGIWMVEGVRLSGAGPPPPEERRVLLLAQSGPVITVSVGPSGEHIGAVTLIRGRGRPPWTPAEARIVEAVAADLGRGVRQAQMYEQEQQLVFRLQELDTAKTDFMSTVSHELRTPLTSIAGYLEMLRDGDAGPVNPAQAKMLDVIDRNTKRLRALIADLLILSRIEAGTFKTQRKTVDLAALVAVARAAIEPAALRAGVTVQAEVAGPLDVPADAEQVDRILMNLLSNAVKFTPAGGRVQVDGYRDGDDVILSVADSGMGIPEPEQKQLFSRFFRASNAVHQAVPGTGLGLAIVYTIVENHDGRIEVASSEGTGTTFTVRLPAR